MHAAAWHLAILLTDILFARLVVDGEVVKVVEGDAVLRLAGGALIETSHLLILPDLRADNMVSIYLPSTTLYSLDAAPNDSLHSPVATGAFSLDLLKEHHEVVPPT